jgi:PASTA domain
MKKLAMLVVVVVLGASASPAFGQATRTWVSMTSGDDLNPCSRTAPCRTFAGAIQKTFTGGEIDALDDGGYGTVTINKSITIDGGGHTASILASGTNGVNINIAVDPNDPNRKVVLRNLTINGTGAQGSVGTNTGLNGVNVINNGAEELQLENLRIANFIQAGIKIAPNVASPSLMSLSLDNVILAGNTGFGLDFRSPDASHQVNALVRNSTVKGTRGAPGAPPGESGIGIGADTGAHVWLTRSTIFDNAIGLMAFARQGSPGIFDSFCDNQILGNVDDGTKPNELCATTAAGAAAPPPQVVTQQVPAPRRCVVPALRGLTVAFARRLLRAANCALGRVARKRTRRRRQVGKVLGQSIRAGRTVAEGTRVNVTVGRR